MRILIELYDKEPVYNYLAAAVFRPDKVYFVGDADALNGKCKNKTERFFRFMEFDCEFVYRYADSADFSQLRTQIKKIVDSENKNGNSCTIDVTGGRDLALVAAGTLLERVAEITCYDKSVNAFRLLSGSKTQELRLGIPCEAFITAAGGTVYGDTRNMNYSPEEWKIIKNVTRLFFENCDTWTSFVKYLQRISKKEGLKVGDVLSIKAPLSLSEGSKAFSCNEDIMKGLERSGAISSLGIFPKEKRVEFKFANSAIANLLVNEGVWLEMAVYMVAKNMPEFSDAQTGVKFVWDIPDSHKPLSEILSDNVPRNEVDVVLSRGISPVFISCKTRFPTNEDLNELYAIKENFGGELAFAIMATTKYVGSDSPIYERAKAMGIGFVDERNFKNETVAERLLKLTGG